MIKNGVGYISEGGIIKMSNQLTDKAKKTIKEQTHLKNYDYFSYKDLQI